MKKNFTLLLVLLIVSMKGYSQFSKTHYIPPLTAATYMSSTTVDVDNYIYVSTPSTTPVSVTITPLGGKYPVATKTITNSTPWVYIISAPSIPDPSATPTKPKPNKPAKDGQDTQLYVPTYLLGTVLKDRGYLIEASDFVYANVRVSSKISSGGSSQAGGLVAKGTSAYGTEFRIGGMENRGVMGSGNGEALMNFASFVATEDNTTVTITLKAPNGTFMFPKTLNGNYPYGYPFPNKDFHYPPAGAPNAVSYTTPTSQNHIYNGPITVKLNKNESYVVAMENSSDTTFESNYMLGGLITSDRNIVVNCGSMAGTSQIKGEVITNPAPYNNAGKDYGFDQIVGADKIGKEFIFVGGSGMAAATKAYDLERAIIIAHTSGTQIFKNGSTTPVATINAGDYYVFNGNDYLNGNLYVKTSENVFAYQGIAGIGSSGKADAGNQNMYFVPPLNCATPSAVNNIPLINEIGITADSNYDTTVPTGSLGSKNGKVLYPNTIVNIVTQRDVNDPTDPTGVKKIPNKVFVNGVELTVGMVGPNLSRSNVTGKTDVPFVVYSYKTTGGNMAVTASAQVYVSFYGSNDNAAFGSYFSGFDTKPSITAPLTSNSICINGTSALSVTSAVPSDEFEWLFSSTPSVPKDTDPTYPSYLIKDAAGNVVKGNTYTPKAIKDGGKGPGYYFVTKKSNCSNTISLPIPVSECPANDDTDPVLNNIDMDSDNDGIPNTAESYGDSPVDFTNPAGGTLTAGGGAYTNPYTGTTTPAGTGPNTFSGNNTGSFTSNLAAGTTNTLTYDLNFNKPTSIGIKYNPAGATAASQSNATFEIKTSLNTTITITNPTNQLLIDTDNDGIYESGITEFSSFDVKFKLNPAVLLPATGTPPALDFKIQTYMANSISFTHNNLSTSQTNSASFSIFALSIPKDSDGDGIPDQVDKDSDNDGITDAEEAYTAIPALKGDANKNGLDDIFETLPATPLADTDKDGVPDYLDLDSDNDGILDTDESGKNALAATAPVVDADSDGVKNYREIDSDNDGCYDLVEVGYTLTDTDGALDTTAVPAVDPVTGKVNGVTYKVPANNYYLVARPKPIVDKVDLNSVCATRKSTITVTETATAGTTNYKWFVSTNNGTTWDLITSANAGNPSTPNTLSYEDYTTPVLKINNYADKYQYYAELSKPESACLATVSPIKTIIVTDAPTTVNTAYPVCDVEGPTPGDNPMDGITEFDITAKPVDTTTPAPAVPNTITYHTSLNGANTNTDLIADPTKFKNTTSPYKMDVYARVQNSAGCYAVSTITLTVSAKLPSTYVVPSAPGPLCDDLVTGTSTDTDGTSVFKLDGTKVALEKVFKDLTPALPLAYTVYFYTNANDAANNITANAIPNANLANYRNVTKDSETIYVRVNNNDTNIPNTCYSSAQFVLNVEKLPTAASVPVTQYTACGNNPVKFTTTGLETLVIGTAQSLTDVTIAYFNPDGTPLTINGVTITDKFPDDFTTQTTTIKAVVTNRNGKQCTASAPAFIPFTVTPAPVVSPYTYSVCDTDINNTFDGVATFNLTSLNDGEISTGTNESYAYYTDLTGATSADPAKLISNPAAFRNDALPSTPFTSTVYARVSNNITNCFSVATVTLNAVSTYPGNYKLPVADQPAPICDSNLNGIATFNLTNAKKAVEDNIKDTRPGIYTFTYYRDQAMTNAITDLANFTNNQPYSQDIYVRVTNTSGTCASSGAYITVNVEKLPVAKAGKSTYQECDDNTDGQLSFTNTVDADVRKGRTDVTVNYYDDADPANTLLFPSNSVFPTTYTTGNITVRAEVINNTPQLCSDKTLIVFQVDVKPVSVTIPANLTADCDDETDPMKQDGKLAFTTSSAIHSTILNGQTDPLVMDIKYFAQDGSPLPSPLPNSFITKTQLVRYTVENKNNLNNAGCTATGTIQFTVNPLPKININTNGKDDKVICADQPAMTFTLDASIQDGSSPSLYSYQWSKDGVDLTGETNYTLTGVNTEGLYAVEVINKTTLCDAVRTINVRASERAAFNESVPFTVTDLTEDNTITVNLAAGLKGDYEYSLDDEIGFYQDSNVFTNVSPGTHLVYIRDKNGCGIESDAVAVIGVPKFFTPNGDGYNDTWNIGGIDPNQKYTIFIYDRYGKLLKELIPQSTQGWDGIFNGNPLPGSDYWYSLKLENGREAKGHFSLKR